MTRGGARNRSGPPPEEGSGRSESRDFKLHGLPAEGYAGDVPDFPLMPVRLYRWEFENKRRFQVYDEDSTEVVRDREAELWAWVWSQPQAHAWSEQAWRWHTIAMWVRTAVVCEGSDATAADKGSIHRFADQIGMTPAGLKENGWKIADAPTPVSDDAPTEGASVTNIKDRLPNGGA